MTKIAVIVVLYNPTNLQLRNIADLSDTTPAGYHIQIHLIDNSNGINNVSGPTHLYYKYNGHNMGIAYAQNQGIREAKDYGCEYVVFFDQDSEYDVLYIEQIVEEYKRIKRTDSFISTLGPLVIDKDTDEAYKSDLLLDRSFSKVDTIISSGSVVETSVFDIVGGLDEKLFIDLVDHEWCWRAKASGYSCYQTSQIVLKHKVGCNKKSIMGFTILISAPVRYYYKYRNYLLLTRKNMFLLAGKSKELSDGF